MNNQNKWNKELLYSAVFCIAGIIIFLLHPFLIIKETFSVLPANVLKILFNLGIYSFFSTATWLVIFLFFFLCSIYLGILSIRKASSTSPRKFFGFFPLNFPTFLAYILILASSVGFVGIIIALLYFTTP